MLKKIVVALLLALALGSISIQLALISKTEIESRIVPTRIPTPTPTLTPDQFAQEIENKTNDYRINTGLNSLQESTPACAVASARLIEINEDWSHKGFYKYTGIAGSITGENLAENYIRVQDVLDGWISSPKHKENLDRPEWNHMCVKSDGNYVVQIFSD